MEVAFVGTTANPIRENAAHSHELWELILYREGTGQNTIGGNVYRFFPGRIFLVPPGFSHCELGDTAYRDYYVRVAGMTWSNSDGAAVLEDEDDRASQLVSHLFSEFHGDHFNRTPLVSALWEALYQFLISRTGKAPADPVTQRFKNQLVRNVSNLSFDLKEVVEQTGYCCDHFRRLFKAQTGLTPHAYLEELRIRYAKELLQSGGDRMRICDVARESGFSDAYYFTRVFKKKTGVSPRVYLSEGKQNDENPPSF